MCADGRVPHQGLTWSRWWLESLRPHSRDVSRDAPASRRTARRSSAQVSPKKSLRNVFILVTDALSLAADDLWWRAYERDHGHVSLWVYNMCLDFFGHYLAQDGMVIALQATSRTTCQTMLVLVRGRVVCCVVV